MGGNNNNMQASQPTMQTSNGSPPMSLATGGSNLAPYQPPAQAPAQYAAQAAQMPMAPSSDSQDPNVLTAINNAKAMTAQMQVLKDSGLFDTPYQKAMKQHPILMGLANGMQAFGQGLTKQPYYTGNQDNQAALQGKQMENMATLSSPANMMNMMFMKQMMAQQGAGQSSQVTSPTANQVINTPGAGNGIGNPPSGATHYSPSTGKFYDVNGQEM